MATNTTPHRPVCSTTTAVRIFIFHLRCLSETWWPRCVLGSASVSDWQQALNLDQRRQGKWQSHVSTCVFAISEIRWLMLSGINRRSRCQTLQRGSDWKTTWVLHLWKAFTGVAPSDKSIASYVDYCRLSLQRSRINLTLCVLSPTEGSHPTETASMFKWPLSDGTSHGTFS